MNSVLIIVTVSVLGPILGSAIGVWKRAPAIWIVNLLSFAAGVMLSISFLQLIPDALKMSSVPVTTVGIMIGALLMFGLDRAIPHIHPEFCAQEQGRNLEKTAVFLIAGIFMHNFPEGMAIAIGGVADTKASITIALAIAIHNIPEGICTSSPYYTITGSRLKSFLLSSSTAIPILAGYLVARFIFSDFNPTAMGLIVSATAGLMIYISADELIPSSCQITDTHSTIFSLLGGVLFVVILGM